MKFFNELKMIIEISAVIYKKNKPLYDGNSDTASSFYPITDYFPAKARHHVFYFLLT